MGFAWRPGIGDPTVVGWVTVMLYACAVAACAVVFTRMRARSAHAASAPVRERRLWLFLVVAFVLLGVNKQLDLQTALTEAGRVLAHRQGWYERREVVQRLFFKGALVVAVAIVAGLLWGAAGAPLPTWVTLLGAGGVAAYVVLRAASIERVIGERPIGSNGHWILEMSAIGMALAGAHWRARQLSGLRATLNSA